MKRTGLVIVIMFVLSAVVYAQSNTITITMRSKASGRGILEFSPIGLHQEVFFDPNTPLQPGNSYTGELSSMKTSGRRGIIIYSNLLSSSRGIFIHEGQYTSDWSKGCIVLETNGFNQMYDYIQRRCGSIIIVIRN